MSGVSPNMNRRFTHGANSTHSGWNERQNSEVRISRKASELGTLEPRTGRNIGRDSMRMTTNQSWADKGAGRGADGFLPDINDGGGLNSARRRAPLPDAMSGAGQNRAAGFKRDRQSVHDSQSNMNPSSTGAGFGVQSGYNPSPKKSDSRLFGGPKDSPRYGGAPINQNTESSNFGVNIASPGEGGSARRSSGLRMSGGMAGLDVGASLDSNNPNRPPLYVPTKRDPNMNRDGTATFGKPPSSNMNQRVKATAAQEY